MLPTLEQKDSLVKTIEIFNEACNYISQIAFEKKIFGQIGLHKLTYYDIREKFGLSAQMTIRAIGKVSESYRIEKEHLHAFKKYSALVYDQRILSFRGLDTVSILSLDGRFKIPIVFGSYAKLEQRRIRGQADLLYYKGNLFLCLVVELPEYPPIDTKETLGIVQLAKDTHRSIALEDLNGFNGRQTVRKAQRERFGKWAFNQLRNFIEYKARIAGVPIILINPKNTSRRCSQCGNVDKANRKSQSEFICVHCNFSLNADYNAAKNISFLAVVKQPIVARALAGNQSICA